MSTLDLNSLVAGKSQPAQTVTYEAIFDRFESKDPGTNQPDGSYLSGYAIVPMVGGRTGRGSRLFVRFAKDDGDPAKSVPDTDAAARLRSAGEAAIAFAAKAMAMADKLDPPAKKGAAKAPAKDKAVSEDDLPF